MRFLRSLLNLSLLSLMLPSAALFAQTAPVGHASYLASGGQYAAFLAIESMYGQSLNGDTDMSDAVLHILDLATGQVHNTQIATYQFRIETDGEHVVFLQRESFVQEDLTGNGDQRQIVLGYYNIASQQVTYTDIVPYYNTGSYGSLKSYSVHGDYITFQSREGWDREDYNGDGDQNDWVVRAHRISTGETITTPLTSTYALVNEGRIATRVSEASSLDYNNDGDNDDNVIVVYDLETGHIQPIVSTRAFNLSSPSSFPALDGNNLYFRDNESTLQQDVDGDGRTSTNNVIMHVDMTSGQISYTGRTGYGHILASGDYLAYESSEAIVEADVNNDGDYRYDFIQVLDNVVTNEQQYFLRGTYDLGWSAYVGRVAEFHVGIDSNNDGDTNDSFMYVVHTEQSEQPCTDEMLCRMQQFRTLLSEQTELASWLHDAVVASMDAAIDAYQDDSQSEMDRMIGAIAGMDGVFDTLWAAPQDDAPHATRVELVETGRPIKDDLHDLYDAAAAAAEESDEEGDEDSSGGDNGNDGPSIGDLLGQLFGMIGGLSLSGAEQADMFALMGQMQAIVGQVESGAISPDDAMALAGPVINDIADLLQLFAAQNPSDDAQAAAELAAMLSGFLNP